MIDRPTGRLFRCHVFSSAHDMAQGRMANPTKQLGDPEVSQLYGDFFGTPSSGLNSDRQFIGNEQVRWLQIPVHDALVVSRLEPPG